MQTAAQVRLALRRAQLGAFTDVAAPPGRLEDLDARVHGAAGDEPCGDCADHVHGGEDHFGSTSASTSNKAWNGAASRFTDAQYQQAAAACDQGSGSVKSRCFLPHHEPGGAANRNGIHAAAQRVSGLKGHDPAAVNRAKAHLRSHYKALGEDPPSSIGGTSTEPIAFDLEADLDLDGAFANAELASGSSGPSEWDAVLILEDVLTTDGREIAPGALEARPTPLPLMMLTETSPGHFGAQYVGNITSIDRNAGTGQILGHGDYDLAGENGPEAARLVDEQRLRWVSADLEIIDYEIVYPGGEGGGGCDGYSSDEPILRITQANIIGATICPFPAFPQAVIVTAGQELPAASSAGSEAAQALGMAGGGTAPVAIAASGAPQAPPEPPRWWFDDPGLTELTGTVVEDSGRVYGHAAGWSQCHTGHADVCIRPPRSPSSYAHFRTGALQTADDDPARRLVAVGQITCGTGHAPLTATARATLEHYDNTGAAVADVVMGEDEFGPWFAGSLRPGVTEEQVRALRAATISPDWRRIGGALELVGLLCVNVGGYPIPRGVTAGMTRLPDAREEQTSLVAAGLVVRDEVGDRVRAILEAELAPVRAVVEALAAEAAGDLEDRMAALRR